MARPATAVPATSTPGEIPTNTCQRGCCRSGESAGHDRNRAHELPVLGSLALQFGRDPHDSIFVSDAFFDQ